MDCDLEHTGTFWLWCIEHLLFECPGISGLDSPMPITQLQDGLFRVCSRSDHAEAVLLLAFPSSHVPVVAATDCLVSSSLTLLLPWAFTPLGPSPPT